MSPLCLSAEYLVESVVLSDGHRAPGKVDGERLFRQRVGEFFKDCYSGERDSAALTGTGEVILVDGYGESHAVDLLGDRLIALWK